MNKQKLFSELFRFHEDIREKRVVQVVVDYEDTVNTMSA